MIGIRTAIEVLAFLAFICLINAHSLVWNPFNYKIEKVDSGVKEELITSVGQNDEEKDDHIYDSDAASDNSDSEVEDPVRSFTAAIDDLLPVAREFFKEHLPLYALLHFKAQGIISDATISAMKPQYSIMYKGVDYRIRSVTRTGQIVRFELEKFHLDCTGVVKSTVVNVSATFCADQCKWLEAKKEGSELSPKVVGHQLLKTLYHEHGAELDSQHRPRRVQFNVGKYRVNGVILIPRGYRESFASVEVLTKDDVVEKNPNDLSKPTSEQCNQDLERFVSDFLTSTKRFLVVPKSPFIENELGLALSNMNWLIGKPGYFMHPSVHAIYISKLSQEILDAYKDFRFITHSKDFVEAEKAVWYRPQNIEPEKSEQENTDAWEDVVAPGNDCV